MIEDNINDIVENEDNNEETLPPMEKPKDKKPRTAKQMESLKKAQVARKRNIEERRKMLIEKPVNNPPLPRTDSEVNTLKEEQYDYDYLPPSVVKKKRRKPRVVIEEDSDDDNEIVISRRRSKKQQQQYEGYVNSQAPPAPTPAPAPVKEPKEEEYYPDKEQDEGLVQEQYYTRGDILRAYGL